MSIPIQETYSPEKVGLSLENEFLDDFVMVGKIARRRKYLTVPVSTGGRITGSQKKLAVIPEDFGAQSLVDEDLLITRGIQAGSDFEVRPHKGGYVLDFGDYEFVVRKANPYEFSSIHPYVVKHGDNVYNHTFIQRVLYSQWLQENNIGVWRMPFSPERASTLAVSWYMLDNQGRRWECVAPSQQNFTWIRKAHFYMAGTGVNTEPKAISVGVVPADVPSYDPALHTFFFTPGSKLRMVVINSPMGAKEWETTVEIDLDTNELKYIL